MLSPPLLHGKSPTLVDQSPEISARALTGYWCRWSFSSAPRQTLKAWFPISLIWIKGASPATAPYNTTLNSTSAPITIAANISTDLGSHAHSTKKLHSLAHIGAKTQYSSARARHSTCGVAWSISFSAGSSGDLRARLLISNRFSGKFRFWAIDGRAIRFECLGFKSWLCLFVDQRKYSNQSRWSTRSSRLWKWYLSDKGESHIGLVDESLI